MSRSVFNFKGLPECLKRIIFTLLIMKFNCCNIICSQWDVGQKKVIWNLDNGKILTALISVHNEHIHFCWAIPKYSASLEWMGNMMSSFKGGGLQFSFFSLMLISEYYYCILNFSLVFRFYKISPFLHQDVKEREKIYCTIKWLRLRDILIGVQDFLPSQKMFQLLIMLWLFLCMFGESINCLVSAIHQILMQQSAFIIFQHCSRAMQLLFQDLNFFT